MVKNNNTSRGADISSTVERFNSLGYPTMTLDEVVAKMRAIKHVSQDEVLWCNYKALQERR